MKNYDIVEITALNLYMCESFWDSGANSEDSRLAKLINSGERKAFVYKQNNDYVGGCAISIRKNENGEYGHFSYFSVRSDLRNKGIGSCIITFAMNYLRRLGIKTMRLNVHKVNNSAIDLYKRNGFVYAEDITPEKISMIKTL